MLCSYVFVVCLRVRFCGVSEYACVCRVYCFCVCYVCILCVLCVYLFVFHYCGACVCILCVVRIVSMCVCV